MAVPPPSMCSYRSISPPQFNISPRAQQYLGRGSLAPLPDPFAVPAPSSAQHYAGGSASSAAAYQSAAQQRYDEASSPSGPPRRSPRTRLSPTERDLLREQERHQTAANLAAARAYEIEVLRARREMEHRREQDR